MIASDGGPKKGYFTPTSLRKDETNKTTATHFILGKHSTVSKSVTRLNLEAINQKTERVLQPSSS